MAAAFRKLLSSEPLCVGTRNEDHQTMRGSTGNADGKAPPWKWTASRRTHKSPQLLKWDQTKSLFSLENYHFFLQRYVWTLRWLNWWGGKAGEGEETGGCICLPALKVTMHFRQANSVASNRSCLNRATTSCKACISDIILFSFWESVLSPFMPRIKIWNKCCNMKAFS